MMGASVLPLHGTPTGTAHSYLAERGLSEATVTRAGLRVEPLGSRARRYGLPADAGSVLALVIPYVTAGFERIRLGIEPADLERYPGGKYRQPARQPLALYDPDNVLADDTPLDGLLLIEGELNALSVKECMPELAVVGLPGQQALTPELAAQLAHIPVVFVWLDRHEPGAEQALRTVADRLLDAGAGEVRLVEGTAGNDANDILVTLGAEDASRAVVRLLDRAQTYEPERAVEMPDARTSWAPVDLASALDGDGQEDAPAFLTRTDGVALLYRGKAHALSGEPEAGKGWFALAASAEVLSAGGCVAYVDFESDAPEVAARMRALGVPRDALLDRFVYLRPDEPLGDEAQADLALVLERRPALVVLDGVTESLVMHGLDLASNTDVASWRGRIVRPLTATGAAVLELDHVVKDREARGRYAIGAQHKLAGVDVSYRIDVVEPFGRGRDGAARLSVLKDRPGHVRRHADEGRIAHMALASAEGGAVRVSLLPPEAAGTFRPTVLMERVSRVLENAPDGMSGAGIRRDVTGKARNVDLALGVLVGEGFVRRESGGEGRPTKHYSVRPYREDEDPATDPVHPVPTAAGHGNPDTPSHPVPTPSGRGVDPDLVPPSSPLRGGQDGGRGHDNGRASTLSFDPDPDADLEDR